MVESQKTTSPKKVAKELQVALDKAQAETDLGESLKILINGVEDVIKQLKN